MDGGGEECVGVGEGRSVWGEGRSECRGGEEWMQGRGGVCTVHGEILAAIKAK